MPWWKGWKRQVGGREMVAAITDGRLDDSAEPSGRASGRGLVKVFGPGGGEAADSSQVSFSAGLRQSLGRSNSHECRSPLDLLPIQRD